MRHYTLTLAVPDLTAAVYGLTPTTDEGTALFAQLEALLAGAKPRASADQPVARLPLTPDVVGSALRASGGSVKGAAQRLGYARSTVREAARRHGVRP